MLDSDGYIVLNDERIRCYQKAQNFFKLFSKYHHVQSELDISVDENGAFFSELEPIDWSIVLDHETDDLNNNKILLKSALSDDSFEDIQTFIDKIVPTLDDGEKIKFFLSNIDSSLREVYDSEEIGMIKRRIIDYGLNFCFEVDDKNVTSSIPSSSSVDSLGNSIDTSEQMHLSIEPICVKCNKKCRFVWDGGNCYFICTKCSPCSNILIADSMHETVNKTIRKFMSTKGTAYLAGGMIMVDFIFL